MPAQQAVFWEPQRCGPPFCCCYSTGGFSGEKRNASLSAPDPGRFKINDRVEALKHMNAVGRWYPGTINGKFFAGGKKHAGDYWKCCDRDGDCCVLTRSWTCGVCCTGSSHRFWNYDVEYDDHDSRSGETDYDRGLRSKYVRVLLEEQPRQEREVTAVDAEVILESERA